VTAVAVWDHEPTDEELLEARVRAGWAPTPTATNEGDVVLGYAVPARCSRVSPSPADPPRPDGR
jgi:hypothetical protein